MQLLQKEQISIEQPTLTLFKGDKMTLKQLYKQAAQKAFTDGIDAGDQSALVAWIRSNCNYRPETEYFLLLGIGCNLADLQAQAKGFKNDVHRAFLDAQHAISA